MTLLRNLPRRSMLLAASAVALGILSFSHAAWSQRTIKIVVPFPPGGSADILARVVGEQVGRTNGVTVVIENRPGAGASIGYETVARAAPDANTLVINGNSLVINPHLRKVNYDPLTSFEPVCYLVSSPQVYVVNPDSPYRTLNDLISAARAKPGEVTLASVGPATTQHIGFEQLKHAAKVNMTHVPFSGGAPAMNALLGGHVASAFANYSEAVEHIKAGKLRVLASASKTRIEPLPDVPTVAELGFKDYEVEVWFGLLAPAKTAKDATAQLASWFTAAMQVPDVKPKLVNLGLYPVGMCNADFGAHIHKQFDEYGRMIRDANIKAE
jgi:tripartite-type tricarboxylate transporter receptor subunit TctC